MSYCTYCLSPEAHPAHVKYHNEQYGYPLTNDDELFGRLLLEINQAGLSWTTILLKEEGFRRAYDNYSIRIVANYQAADKERLLADPGIIRNRLKVEAAITNAKTILSIQATHGSFYNWLYQHHQANHGQWTKAEWVKLFKKTFKFTGGEITNEFLMSIGFLPGAHQPDCPYYQQTIDAGAVWAVKA